MSNSKTLWKQLIKDYCSNCSFAGIHFIADHTKHWIERVVWLILVILSWYGSGLLIIAAWEAFVLSPISFGVETVYIDWDTKMPTVAVCELENKNKRFAVSDALWTVDHLTDLEDMLQEIAYYRGVSRVLLKKCFKTETPDINCPMSNYSYYAALVRSDCKTLLKNCSYDNKEFSCCKYFLPIETDIGTCFIINSVQTKKQRPYPMVKNMRNKEGALKFQVTLLSTITRFSGLQLYTLGDDEVPTITTSLASTLKLQFYHKYRRVLAVRDIENDPSISETTPKQRACRFHDENEGGLYPKYSYSACTVLCRKRAQLKLCNCTDHFMLKTTDAERCNITGMNCLNSMSRYLTALKPSWSPRPGLSCNCRPSCDEREITVINDVDTRLANSKISQVEIVLAYLPTERFKRRVVRSRLDLVVSVGGTTSLFVGASVLSFVELFFFFTVRLFNDVWLKRQQAKNRLLKQNNDPMNNSKYLEEMTLRNWRQMYLKGLTNTRMQK